MRCVRSDGVGSWGIVGFWRCADVPDPSLQSHGRQSPIAVGSIERRRRARLHDMRHWLEPDRFTWKRLGRVQVKRESVSTLLIWSKIHVLAGDLADAG